MGHDHADDRPGGHHHHPRHDHHDHDHAPIVDGSEVVGPYEVLETAVRELLIEKGVITAADVQGQIDLMETRNAALGATIVARAWTDPDFRARLKANGRAGLAEMGIEIGQIAEITVVENGPDVHHLVVCTLCSCYPRMVLGVPPAWYKSVAYRARAVSDPRGVLREFGVELPPEKAVTVLDSTADMRYLVIPERPAGTEHLDAEALAALVTRDSMIGAGLARQPAA